MVGTYQLHSNDGCEQSRSDLYFRVAAAKPLVYYGKGANVPAPETGDDTGVAYHPSTRDKTRLASTNIYIYMTGTRYVPYLVSSGQCVMGGVLKLEL